MALHLHLEVRNPGGPAPEEALLAVVIEKRDVEGQPVRFYGVVGAKDDVVSRGFLAASMRQLSDASTEWLPQLTMQNPQPLAAGEVIQVAIELYPHATLFRAGETLEVVIAGHELARTPPLLKDFSDNHGTHVVHTGGDHGSYLLVPTLP